MNQVTKKRIWLAVFWLLVAASLALNLTTTFSRYSIPSWRLSAYVDTFAADKLGLNGLSGANDVQTMQWEGNRIYWIRGKEADGVLVLRKIPLLPLPLYSLCCARVVPCYPFQTPAEGYFAREHLVVLDGERIAIRADVP